MSPSDERNADADLKHLQEAREELGFPTLTPAPLDADSRRQVRAFCKKGLDLGSNPEYAYRHLPDLFPLEKDLLWALERDAFVSTGGSDDYQCELPDLKLLRRAAFRRYAFGLARQINRRLAARGVSRLWLWKDFLLPRIPLALLVGYGAVLGSVPDQLWILRHDWRAQAIGGLSLALSLFLIYNNVRDRIGDVPEAVTRAFGVLAGAVVWCLFFCAGGRWLMPAAAFDWWNAALVSEAALLVAIVAQFFFTAAGSIADPL